MAKLNIWKFPEAQEIDRKDSESSTSKDPKMPTKFMKASMKRLFGDADVSFALMMVSRSSLASATLLPIRIGEIAMKETEREMIAIVHAIVHPRGAVLTTIIQIRVRLHGVLVMTGMIAMIGMIVMTEVIVMTGAIVIRVVNIAMMIGTVETSHLLYFSNLTFFGVDFWPKIQRAHLFRLISECCDR
jgi:hypothetical protein